MSDPMGPGDYAREITAANDRLVAFINTCPDADWTEHVLVDDQRAVGVVLDHVAHAQEYFTGWLKQILAGSSPPISAEIVDQLNAEHASTAGRLTRVEVATHLKESGDALTGILMRMRPDALDLDGGRVRRLAEIAVRHADDHRTELAAGLAAGTADSGG